MGVYRCFNERKKGFGVEADLLLEELRGYVGIGGLDSLRILSRYDVEGITEEIYGHARATVFSQPQTDDFYDENPPDFGENARTLVIEALPGQFDKRADSSVQCLELLAAKQGDGSPAWYQAGEPSPCLASPCLAPITVRTAKLYVFYGELTDGDMDKIRRFLINPVESREAAAGKPDTLAIDYPQPEPVGLIEGFIDAGENDLQCYLDDFSLAMDIADLRLLHGYFRDVEKRDPTVTELRVIDTYWSDHCRHTTFFTHLEGITIDDPEIQAAYETYLGARREVYGDKAEARPQTLMDIATIAAKVFRSRGLMTNIEISEEVNACSIHIDANVDGKTEDWLLMFKNETHNHPTEVEPFGGASTCVGGAIRDPLSGRAFVYHAMRVTGAGDPRAAIGDTLPDKLPQKQLTITAARGNSSYGNQIGLTAGLVHEIYHPGYIAKRMELGAVVGAVKAGNVIRETPTPGDKVILLGGRTGRDGIGGATGSSRSQTIESLVTMASEVQKGNPQEERKIQRLFRDPEVTKMIKKSNDFGAGGVSVAVGELADGLDIDLSLVRLKYGGLDGTEIAISESQERMAVVTAASDADAFIEKAAGENLEAYVIAEVTASPRMVMSYDGDVIVDLSREFLSKNGAVKHMAVHVPVSSPGQATADSNACACADSDANANANANAGADSNADSDSDSDSDSNAGAGPIGRIRALAGDLRYCSQRGLQEMFDDTAGAASVLVINGGRTQSTPVQAMAALLPVDHGSGTTTCSVMAYGFDPYLASRSPFEGAKTAVITSVAKLVAAGCDPDSAYLSFQEYFERLGDDPVRWGKPFAALLGALEAQMGLGLAAIGGKDSMSGSFLDLNVPPALVSFAIAPSEAGNIITPEFKEAGHDVVLFEAGGDPASTRQVWNNILPLIRDKTILSAWAVTDGGVDEGIFKMALGNEIGFEYASDSGPGIASDCGPASSPDITAPKPPCPACGSIIAELARPVPGAALIGRTIAEPAIKAGGETLPLAELRADWEKELEPIFHTKTELKDQTAPLTDSYPALSIASPAGAEGGGQTHCHGKPCAVHARDSFAKPRALILAFPGANSEFDAARAVSRAGGVPKIAVVRNLTAAMLEDSFEMVLRELGESQMLILPGGPTLGDEPDGPAKFINLFFRDGRMADAIQEHIKTKDGLILGLCNGFQGLIKLGLVPFGEIVAPDADCPTLTTNAIGRHQARYVYTRIASVNSPWLSLCRVGDIHTVAVSHGEGRFNASPGILDRLVSNGQIATQYTDSSGAPSMDTLINPNGSQLAVEGLLSPDGRVFGKMGHSERYGEDIARNVYGNKFQPVFESGVAYYR